MLRRDLPSGALVRSRTVDDVASITTFGANSVRPYSVSRHFGLQNLVRRSSPSLVFFWWPRLVMRDLWSAPESCRGNRGCCKSPPSTNVKVIVFTLLSLRHRYRPPDKRQSGPSTEFPPRRLGSGFLSP